MMLIWVVFVGALCACDYSLSTHRRYGLLVMVYHLTILAG